MMNSSINPGSNTLTMLASYDNPQSAYIDKGFLESHGIPAKVFTSALSQIFPTPVQSSDQICLYVPQDFLEEAVTLMNSR